MLFNPFCDFIKFLFQTVESMFFIFGNLIPDYLLSIIAYLLEQL